MSGKAAADGCVYVVQPMRSGLPCQYEEGCNNGCAFGEYWYAYSYEYYDCDTGQHHLCTRAIPGEHVRFGTWFQAAKPTGSAICENAWTAVYNACNPSPEPKDCREPLNHSSATVGDPVDLTTGVLEQDVTDLDLGGGLAFRRHYASSSPEISTIGKSWQHGLDWKLVYKLINGSTSTPTELVLVQRPLSKDTAFSRTGATGEWSSGPRGSGALSGDEPDGFVYTDDDGTRVRFDRVSAGVFALAELQPPGQAPITVSRSGDTTTYARGASSLAVTTYATGHAWAGKVASVAGAGQTFTYAYDGSSCLREVAGPNPANPTETVTWKHWYANTSTGNCPNSRLTKLERKVGSGRWVVLGDWTHSSNRVSRMDEPAVDQTLHLAYSFPSSSAVKTAIRDTATLTVPPLAEFTCSEGKVTIVTGEGGPGVSVPYAAATFTPSSSTAPANQWKTVTDLNGSKTLYEAHDERGRPGVVTDGWDDADGDDVLDPGESYERRREYTYHPRLDGQLEVRETSAIPGAAGDLVTVDDYDDPDASGDTSAPNEAPTSLLHRRIVSGYTLDAGGDPVAFTDQTIFEYDSEDRLISIAGPRAANYTEIDYDATSGSRSAIRRFLNGEGSTSLAWTFSDFDARGNPETITDPNGRVTELTYDALSRVRTVTPPHAGAGSSTTTFTYDIDGNLTRVDFPLDSAGNPVFLEMGYDTKRNLLFLADSQDNAIVYEYQKGRATREARYTGFTDYANRGTLVGDAEYSYTTAGRLLRAFNPLFADDSVYAELDHDPKGNPTRITDENGREDVLVYDALDRLTEIQQVRTATYETGFAYDARSNVIAVTDAAGKTTDLLHDDRGNVVQTVSPDTGITLFLHGQAGNLVQKIEDAGGSAERITSYEYDGMDRLLEIDLPNDPDWVFTYDTSAALNQKGRLASVTNGVVTTHLEYTQRGDVAIERTIIDGLGYEVAYAYDAAGNRIAIEGPSGARVETSYAGLRPSRLDVTAGATTEEIQDLTWYPFGTRIAAKFPPADGGGDNTVLSTRTLNLRGQVEELDVTAASGAILDRSYVYDFTTGSPGPDEPGPNLDQLVDHLHAGESRFYFYDELDRLAAAKDLSGATLHAYGYDAVGNRTSKQGPLGSSTLTYKSSTNRLDAATGAEARDWAHDAYGNRIYDGAAAYAGTRSLVYDDANRLVVAKNPTNGFATLGTYTHDAFGRRVKKVAGGETVLFFYDTDGHLVAEVEKVPAGDDRARLYVFLESELVGLVDEEAEVGAAETPLGLWLPLDLAPGLALVLLALASGTTVALVTRRLPAGAATAGSGVGLLLVCASGGSGPVFSWVHTDPLGTPLAVTGRPTLPANVEAIWRANHEPFGKAAVDEDPDGDLALFTLNVRFPGQYEDAETDWHSNFYRTYDSSTGRYLEPDPIGQAGGINVYAYVSNAPSRFIDPFGLDLDGSWSWHGRWPVPPYFPSKNEHLNRNRNNYCPCNEPTNDSRWTQDIAAYGTKYRSPEGFECAYKDGALLPDSTHSSSSWLSSLLPSVEQNYSFNFTPTSVSFSHIYQDVIPSYFWQDYPSNQTNNGEPCSACPLP